MYGCIAGLVLGSIHVYTVLISVVIVVASYEVGLETLYLAKQEGMINGDYAFILFELNQGYVDRKKNVPFLWFKHVFLNRYRFVLKIVSIFFSILASVRSANNLCSREVWVFQVQFSPDYSQFKVFQIYLVLFSECNVILYVYRYKCLSEQESEVKLLVAPPLGFSGLIYNAFLGDVWPDRLLVYAVCKKKKKKKITCRQ